MADKKTVIMMSFAQTVNAVEDDDDIFSAALSVMNGCTQSSSFTALRQVVEGVCDGRQDREPPVYVEDFVDRTVPGYSETEFRQHFRMGRTCFEVRVHCFFAKYVL